MRLWRSVTQDCKDIGTSELQASRDELYLSKISKTRGSTNLLVHLGNSKQQIKIISHFFLTKVSTCIKSIAMVN